MKKTKIKYLAANIIAPGVGHFAMKKWIRGWLYLLGSAICLVWLVIAFAHNVIGLYYRAMDPNDAAIDVVSFIIALFLPIITLCLLWTFSYIDIFFFCNPPVVKKAEKGSEPTK